jgi:hypothetical protein
LSTTPVDLAGYRRRRETGMADPNNPIGDEVSFEPNGTVRISLAGRPFRWRRPTFGEYRKFKEAWASVAEEETAITTKMNAETPEGERSAPWRIRHELALRELFGGWFIDVWRVLCEKDAPATDDIPPWATSVAFANGLFDHWTKVPLAASSL